MFSDKFGGEPEGLNPQWEAKLSLEAAGVQVIDLTGSNPTSAGIFYPAHLPSLLARPSILRYEPSSKGHPEARRAISRHYASRGRALDPDNLILTASTSEAYSFLFKLLCNPGDEILIPSPTYPLFDTLAALENISLVRYPLRLDGRWRADFGFLRSMVSTRSKALILVNPNNPTGHLADAEEIRSYLDFAAEYGLALIVDEVFSDYLLGDRPFLPIESEVPLVFTLNGFSKTLGLPQLKLGWIHVAGEYRAVQSALTHLEWIADAFLSVNTPVQSAAADLLALADGIQSSILSRVKANLAAAESMVARRDASGPGKVHARLLRPEAGWYLVLELDLPLSDEDFTLELLTLRRVHAHSGHLFGFEDGCRLVLSLVGPEPEFQAGLERILEHAAAIGEAAHG